MFKLFESPSFNDPVLGPFKRTRRLWRGTFVLAGMPLSLSIAGTRDAPDAEALAIVRQLPATWSTNRELVARALIEHLEPYREASAASETDSPDRPLPIIEQTEDVWQFVALLSASVTPLDGKLIAEIALAATWDEEHTLGARFEGPVFVELNGSIVPK